MHFLPRFCISERHNFCVKCRQENTMSDTASFENKSLDKDKDECLKKLSHEGGHVLGLAKMLKFGPNSR